MKLTKSPRINKTEMRRQYRRETGRISEEMAIRIEELSTRLHRYARRHQTSQITADDMYQLAVIEILTTCNPQDNDTYMLRLANWSMNKVLNRERVYSIKVTATEDEDTDENPCFTSPETVESAADTNSLRTSILAVTVQLSALHQQIIALLAEGCNHSEIARQLGVSHTKINYNITEIRKVFAAAGLHPAALTA